MGHLEDFTFLVEDCRVRVQFSCHCFTEGRKPTHTPDLFYNHAHEKRAFSMERYRLSFSLPDIIRNIGNTSVYHSKTGNFFFIRTVEGLIYAVFFRAYKAKSKDCDVLINVESAYPKQNMTRYGAPVKFPTVIKYASKGSKPRAGKLVHIKKK